MQYGSMQYDKVRYGNMRHGHGVRGPVTLAVLVSAAALMVTGCQPTESSSASASSPSAGSAPVSSPSAASPSAASPSTSPAASAPGAAGSPSGAVPKCPAGSLEVAARQAAARPAGTGTGAAVVRFTNVSAKSCVLKGHPSVAGAGNGSPEHNSPLAVTPTGSASPVTVAPGGRAWVKLTFVQVQGEADGYCVSGAEPVAYPTIVVGLPGSGAHQVALDDGQFAECDNKVTVTAVSAVEPS
ncbi:DUF4232 domain-containing protein [Streptomyces sp. NY05-11A]|nr:DUF4232 domain-containing protein [Streptomyces sp. NY05-11A]MDX2678732.1 DUF4232 domain-containing protein [Streptomyces sp. NY05-11A]